MRASLRSSAALLLALVGCAGDDAEPAPVAPDPLGCAAGELELDDGRCLPAGIQENGCAAGEAETEMGACRPAGIPPELCAEGFVHDPAEGCVPVLPAAPCTLGTMAVPGETRCREIAACGTGTWGAIPISSQTQHVDASYTGGASNGTAAQPWTTIQEAVNAAASGAVVAVAAGSYVEDIATRGQPVTIWGRCPSMVEIVGAGGQAALLVGEGALGSVVRGLAVRGPGAGIVISGAADIAFEELWVHHTQDGIVATDQYGQTSITIAGALVEQSGGSGVIAFGSEISVEASVVRDGQANPAFGFVVQDGVFSGVRAHGRFNRCIAERNRGVGFLVVGSDATIEASVARDTLYSTPPIAWGIAVQFDLGLRSAVTVRSSMVERNDDAGIMISGSDATIEGTVVRDSAPGSNQAWGIAAQSDESGAPGKAIVRSSLINRARSIGIAGLGAELEIESSVVRDTQSNGSDAGHGLGVLAQLSATTGARSQAVVRTSVIEWNRSFGMLAYGADATIDATLVRGTLPDHGNGTMGLGIAAFDADIFDARSSAHVLHSIVEGSSAIGVAVGGSDATVEATIVRDTQPEAASQRFGRGVQFQPSYDDTQPSSGAVRACVIERSHEVGVAAIRSIVAIDGTLIRDVAPTLADGLGGDGLSVVLAPEPVLVSRSRIEAAARAGISAFGAPVELSATRIECAPIPLDAETLGTTASSFADRGGNVCGCGADTITCRVVSSMLAAPEALEPPTSP